MYENIMDTIGFVKNADPEVGSAMELELARQRRNLELIASENIVSPAVMAAMGSVLTNKYAEGYPGKRYYGGCEDVDIVENIAIERAKELFGAKFANVQPQLFMLLFSSRVILLWVCPSLTAATLHTAHP